MVDSLAAKPSEAVFGLARGGALPENVSNVQTKPDRLGDRLPRLVFNADDAR